MSIPVRSLHDYAAEVSEHSSVRRGLPLPLGARTNGGGVNFALFSRHASRVRLELLDQTAGVTPSRFILDAFRELDMHYPETNAKRWQELQSIRLQLVKHGSAGNRAGCYRTNVGCAVRTGSGAGVHPCVRRER